MSVIIPYLLPMLLGRTIDLRTYSIGNNIYDDDNFTEVSVHKLNASYVVVQGNSFPYEDFRIPIDIALKMKTNYLSSSSGILGLDGFLKDTFWMFNSVVVPIVVTYTTVQKSIAENIPLLENWKTRVSGSSTHYATKISYGGWLVSIYRFQCDILSDVIALRKIITDILGTSGLMDDKMAGLWKRVGQATTSPGLRGRVTLSNYVFSSFLMSDGINSIEELMKIIQDVPKTINGVGVPLVMELQSLNELDNSFPKVVRNNALFPELTKLDLFLDDIKYTKVEVDNWTKNPLSFFNEKEEKEISDLLDSLQESMRIFYEVTEEISLYGPMDRSMFEEAFSIYSHGLGRETSYNMVYRKLKEDIDAECENDFHQGIKGLLKVYDYEKEAAIGVGKGGLKKCQQLCLSKAKCRSVGFGDSIDKLDLVTGQYFKYDNQCWIYYRSTSTAIVEKPIEIFGDIKVFDRICY